MNPIIAVNIKNHQGDTFICCFEYNYFSYLLCKDSANSTYIDKMDAIILTNDTFNLFTNTDFLASIQYHQIVKHSQIDSIYEEGGYNLLLRTYFRKIGQANEAIYFLNTLVSKHNHAVFFPYWGQPYHKNIDDTLMDDKYQDYILYLLFKNGIYCHLDSNLNTTLLSKWCNPNAELYNISSADIELR